MAEKDKKNGARPSVEKSTPAKPTQEPPAKKVGRVDHPNVASADTKLYPFKEAVPAGYDFAKHKPLKKRDYEADHLFYEYRAVDCENKAKAFRVQAEEAKLLGSAQDRNKAKRYVKLQEKMAVLKSQLIAQGINVEELLATAAANEK